MCVPSGEIATSGYEPTVRTGPSVGVMTANRASERGVRVGRVRLQTARPAMTTANTTMPRITTGRCHTWSAGVLALNQVRFV